MKRGSASSVIPRHLLENVQTRLARLPVVAQLYAVLVLVPTLIIGLYWGLIAHDIYTAEARFAIRSASTSSAGGLLNQFLGTSSSGSSSEDAEIVRDYILSREMLSILDEAVGLRQHYASDAADWFARLDDDASEEEDLEYYRDRVTINIDETAYITSIELDAFTPEMAQKSTDEIIRAGEQLVNRMSATIANDTLTFAREELVASEGRVRTATQALTAYRTRSRSIDPGEETSAVLQIVTQLEGRVATARAELAQAEAYMRTDSAQVKTLRSRVNALKAQAARERKRLASEGDTNLTQVIFGYEPLALDQKLAEQQYTSALASLEAARIEAQRKQRYLIAFVRPTLPDEAQKPTRTLNTLLVLVIGSVAFGIGALIWSAVQEHARL